MKKFLSIIGIVLVVVLCSSLFLMLKNNDAPISNDKSNSSSNSSTEKTIDFSNKTYLAFGDSITWGADYSRAYARMDNPYPELVANELELKSHVNLAVSGATLCVNTLDLVCMTDRIVSYTQSADIVSVLMGVNDFNRSLPLGTIEDCSNTTVYGALNLIAKHFQVYYTNSFVFFMTPYKVAFGGKDSFTENSQGYNLLDVANAIKEVAKNYGYPVLDLFSVGKYELEMYNADNDGIHPSQEFIRNYTAPQIAEFIRKNYKAKK